MKTPFVTILIISTFVSACRQADTNVDFALESAGSNRAELEKVISHYSDNRQKREAAEWLIANMPGHAVTWSDGIQAFADSVMLHGLTQERGNQLWDSLRTISGTESRLRDIECVDAEFLIDNIEKAFETWENSPWRDEVNLDRFKKYVLPYRVDNELLRKGWRDSLALTYAPLVKDCKTAKEAFERLRNAINSVKRAGKYNFPYVLDAVALRNYYSGVCLERCVLLANACRALGLPVVVDNCGKWANYSDNTHTWVALVLDDGTYTIVDDDSVARKHNTIDSSIFRLGQTMPGSYPYTPEFKKRLVKVWRQTYHLNPVGPVREFGGDVSRRLFSPRLVDVSDDYGIEGSVTVRPSVATDGVWLCTHSLTSGWIPQAYAEVSRGAARFDNISDSVVMLPMCMSDNKAVPVGAPFYLSDGKKIEIKPDTTRFVSATLTRKYPLNSTWLNRYSQIPSSRLEGCDNSDFVNPDTLHTIREVPVYYNSVEIDSDRPYRYFRIIADLPSYANMDRFNIYDKSGALILSEKRGKKLYFDFGSPKKIGRIEYFPWNDGNFVDPGHEYELAYWCGDHWQSIDHRISRGYELTFDNIPAGALLILHDRTEGKEERPFTLQNNRQIWW